MGPYEGVWDLPPFSRTVILGADPKQVSIFSYMQSFPEKITKNAIVSSDPGHFFPFRYRTHTGGKKQSNQLKATIHSPPTPR